MQSREEGERERERRLCLGCNHGVDSKKKREQNGDTVKIIYHHIPCELFLSNAKGNSGQEVLGVEPAQNFRDDAYRKKRTKTRVRERER